MKKINVHAGDFGAGIANANFDGGLIYFPWQDPPNGFEYLDDIEQLDVATEESVKRIGGTIGWGAAGALVLGPVGLLAGLLLGGKKNEVTFAARFANGKKIFATADKEVYKKLLGRVFR